MKYLYILLSLFLISACTNNKNKVIQNSEGLPIVIEPLEDKQVDMCFLDTIRFRLPDDQQTLVTHFEETTIIPLETKNSALIGYIQKIVVKNNKIYVLNNAGNKGEILIFDQQGKFQAKLEKNGRGPGEYINLGDFQVDTEGNIYIHDAMRSDKILMYTNDLQYNKTITLECVIRAFTIFNGDIWGYTARSDYRNPYKHLILVMDMNGKVKNKYFPFKTPMENIISNLTTFSTFGSKLYINIPFAEIICSVDSLNKIRGEYYLEYLAKNTAGEPVNAFAEDKYKAFYPLGDKFFVQTSTIRTKDQPFSSYLLGLYYKNSHTAVFADMLQLQNDFSKNTLTLPWGQIVKSFIGDSIMVHPIEAIVVLNAYKNNPDFYKQLNGTNKQIIDKLKEDENPVLFLNKIQ